MAAVVLAVLLVVLALVHALVGGLASAAALVARAGVDLAGVLERVEILVAQRALLALRRGEGGRVEREERERRGGRQHAARSGVVSSIVKKERATERGTFKFERVFHYEAAPLAPALRRELSGPPREREYYN
ncbi:hypothetical protein T492DRAFT_1144163 [Pavlovales sp. CCMP2436]|nr:hypothetical protein T492DRAFT_1144163 [Pavlovales sp. CCMP2436]